jgi:Xaa-Pro aminopeptidase
MLSEYVRRRQTLLNAMPPASVALIASGEEQIRNRDVHFPFRVESDFVYLTGFSEPDAVLILIRSEVLAGTQDDSGEHQAWLCLRPKDPTQELWEGRRLGVEQAADVLAIDQAWSIDELDQAAAVFLTQAQQVFFSFTHLADWSAKLRDWLVTLKAQVRKGVAVPTALCDLDSLLHEQRLFKSAAEVTLLRQAAQISVKGHLAAMRHVRAGMYEYQLQSELEHAFRMAGSERVAFNSIVAGGANACILHYTENECVLADGDLVLIDAGAESAHYAGDISHTFPVSGRFSDAQKALYDVVLAAQAAAMAQVYPGNRFDAMHQAATRVITQGLCDLGVLSGALDVLLEQQAYKAFYMHNTGHWLGLDVHDVGRYKVDGDWRCFQPGMVLTVEPGLYIAPDAPVAEKWRGIGIRIEDNLLVTSQGYELLTQGLPRTTQEIEQWMAQR